MSLDELVKSLESRIGSLTAKGSIGDEFIINGVDLRIRAPNAIQWVTGEQWLNLPSVWKHVRQYQIIRDFFQLRCPICNKGAVDCWGKGEEELKAEILLIWDPLIQEDRCPSCKITRSDFVEDGFLKPYDTLIGVAGMRSGKSVVAGMIGTYIRHVFITMGIRSQGMLHKIFGLLPTQNLEIAFVATTSTQALQTIWSNFQKQSAAAPWFKHYVEWVKKREDRQVTPDGVRRWVYKELEDSITDDWIGMNCVSLNSNSAGMAGRTRIAFFVDELSRFGLGDSKMGADEIWAVFEHSLKTLRGARDQMGFKDFWLGSAIAISSPISIEDKTMVLHNQAADTVKMYAWKYATWEFNPFQPRASFDDDYKRDPILAERDFGANPPNATNPLVMDPVRFWSSIDHTAKPTGFFRITHPIDKSKREYVGAELETSIIDQKRPLYIFGDSSKSFDQFALVACSHMWLPSFTEVSQKELRDFQEKKFGGTHPTSNEHLSGGYYLNSANLGKTEDAETLTLVSVHEWSLRIIPEPNKNVWFESVVDILKKLVKYRKIAMVAFDSWNSESTLQRISDMGIPAQTIKLTVDDFTRAVQDTMLGRLRLQPPRESDKLSIDKMGTLIVGTAVASMSAEGATIYELMRLERSKDLKQVSNPRKGMVRGENSDDLAHCLVGSHRLIQESIGVVRNNSREIQRAKEAGGASQFVGGLIRHGW
jgi:hypothetical protein